MLDFRSGVILPPWFVVLARSCNASGARLVAAGLLFLGTLLLAATAARAQQPDTTLIRYSGQLTGQYTSGGVNRTLLATSHNVTLLRGLHFGAPLTGSFQFGRQDGRLREREWLLNATPYYWKGHFRFYGIGGYERSNLRGIDQRYQLGAGPGWAFYTDSLGREVALSNLLLREATYFRDGSERVVTRSSARLKVVYTRGVLSLNSTTFYQPNLRDFGDYRASELATLALRFTARFSLTSTYTFTYENRVLEGRPRANTNLTVGVAFSTK
ncbi:DUF481 domain-containing protein [Hymenobacter weizhouensis]|uniref:DUF481 domain-containing protein n=1 Tax=Hymenobacter sp. YIM 151500-1 TaxID=2987689 RepID=UPI002227B51C|nr:DUF481 domain-containing protein [Hymenobacter sp. YIM 151500-1]UYZ63745.1 DUF481 domain-containing protein [Hymenobacter sp. YIM 151500-1]